jgi:hypothetical protein
VMPIVGCFDVHTGGDAAFCIADVAGEIGTVMHIAGRTFKPLIRLGDKSRLWSSPPNLLMGPRKQNAKWFSGQNGELTLFERQVLASYNTVATGQYRQHRGMFQRVPGADPVVDSTHELVRVDSFDNVLVRNISTTQTPDFRWWNPHDQKPYGPRLSALAPVASAEAQTFTTTQRTLLPGQFPGAVQLNEVGEHGYDLSVTAERNIRVVRRSRTLTDVIIDDVSYRFDDTSQNGMIRKLELEPPMARLDQLDEQPMHCAVKRELTEVSCTGALVLLSTTRPATEPAQAPFLLGEQASHAFMTRRFRPVLRFAQLRGHARPQGSHLLVDDGKISTWIDETLPGKGRHSAQMTGRKILAAVPAEIALHLGITTPLTYRSTVSGRLMKDQTLGLPDNLDDAWRARINQELPVVQLDSICKTINDQRELRAVRLSLDDGNYIAVEADSGQFYKAKAHPGDAQLQFSRMTSDTEIDAYLKFSEGYRLGAGRRTLNKDMDNIARMLFELQSPGVDMERVYRPYSSIMENYAKNILTNEDALENFVTLTKSSISNFKQMAGVDPVMRQHVASVLDALLPATVSKHPWLPVPATDLPLKTTGENIRKHLNSTNLAFLLIETQDAKHHVYYALAGGKRGKNLTLRAPAAPEGSAMTFIDARERMSGQAPDPVFTSLPVIRTAKKLKIRQHDRYLDAERLIATAFKQDMSGDVAVTKIHFFTLMDTCNSCGGFVMPRLKLDFPKADFSVSYILPYTPPS